MVIVLSDEDIERMPAALRGRLMHYLASRHKAQGGMTDAAVEMDGPAAALLWEAADATERRVIQAFHADGGTATTDRLVRAAGCDTARALSEVLWRINGRLRRLSGGQQVLFCTRIKGRGAYAIGRATWLHLHALLEVEERRGQFRIVAGPVRHGEA